MKINYNKPVEPIKAEAGDLIEFNDKIIGLVITDTASPNGNLKIVYLKYSSGNDWFRLEQPTGDTEFKNGKYKIIAKAKDWEINIK